MSTPFVSIYTAIPILAAQCAPVWDIQSDTFRQLKRIIQWGNEPMTIAEVNQQCDSIAIAWMQTLVFVSVLAVDTRASFVQGLSVSADQFKVTVNGVCLTNCIGVWDTNWDRCFNQWLTHVFGQSTRPSIQQWCRRLYYQLVHDQSQMTHMQTQSMRVQYAVKHNTWTELQITDYFLILNALPLPALNQFYTRVSTYVPDKISVEWDHDICTLSAVFEPISEGLMVAMKKNSVFYQFFLKQHNRYADLWGQCTHALQLIASDSLYRPPVLKQLTQTADALVQTRLDIVDRCVHQLAAIQP
ncbi:hypothetical protein CL648_04065 [bacterium]|nr:hypothetical protein [bacterium]|tara:strand:- start:15061 stop:15960 length:900 start_codon:yes stop_codon:yes gene_type:complete